MPSLRAGAAREERFKHLRLVVSGRRRAARRKPCTGPPPTPRAARSTPPRSALERPRWIRTPRAFFMYTSGTTGFPKGAMHHHAIVRNLVDRAFRMAITPADTIMMYLPLFHLFGFSDGALMSMVTGARQVLTETFDPAREPGADRAGARDDPPRLRHALQGTDGGARAFSQRRVQRPNRHPRHRHVELRADCAQGAQGVRPLALGIRDERVRRRRRAQRARFHRGAVHRGVGIPRAGIRDPRGRSPDGAGSTAGGRRRDPRAELHDHAGLLRQAHRDGTGARP